MLIKFTIFNNGQESYEFDTDTIKGGMVLDKFLVSSDKDGIYIVPMLMSKDGTFRQGGDVLERKPSDFELELLKYEKEKTT